MKIKQKIACIISVAFIFIFFFLLIKQNHVKKDESRLIVGTSADYPPYAFIDTKTNTIVGFDIDIAQEIARRMQKKIVVKDIPFTSLIFDLLAKEIDIVAAGLTPTARKSKNVHFSQLYLQADPLIVLTKSAGPSITSLQDLAGKKVVVNTGYTADLYLSDKAGIDLVRLKTPAESFMALKSGSVDAFVAARSSLITFLNKQDVMNQFRMFILPDSGDSYALAINKNNEQLLHNVNMALDSMQQDGTLESLKKKWGLDA